MGKFLGWVGGILAVVIAGVAVAYLTKQQATTVQGMVFDSNSNLPVHEALVEVKILAPAGGEPFHDSTDANGSYLFDLSDLGKSTRISLRVKANGYKDAAPAVFS